MISKLPSQHKYLIHLIGELAYFLFCTALQKHTGMKLGSMNFKNCQNMIKMTSLFIPTVVSSFPTNVHLKAHFNTKCPSSFDFQTFLRSCTSFSEDHFYRAWGKQIFVLVRVQTLKSIQVYFIFLFTGNQFFFPKL